MAMRDLIPWGRQQSQAPMPFSDEPGSIPFLSLRRDVDRLFDDFFRAPFGSGGFGRALTEWPSVEVRETDGELRVTAEMPGLGEKDVELLLEDGMLTLQGEKKSEREDKDRGWSERFYGRFERRIALPAGIDEKGAKAEFRDGILTVTFPRSGESERGRRIPINDGTRH